MSAANWRASRSKRAQVALISGAGYRLIQALGATLRWRLDGFERFGADISEVERNRENPYCCGAGGGLLFADKEEEPGSRISDVRFKQLRQTGAATVVTACPFCSIMLKGAQSSAADAADVQFVDLMTFVNGRLQKAGTPSPTPPPS